MKKNIFIILFFIIFPVILSESIFLDSCENGEEPSDKNDCFKRLDKNKKYPDYCCYLESKSDPSKKKCKLVPFSAYSSKYTKEIIDGELYEIDCGVKQSTYPLEQCGNIHKEAKKLGDCKKYSTFVDSCCYYKKDDQNKNSDFKENSCYWLGSKYEGKINWAGIDLQCDCKFLHLSLFMIILSILFLF